MKEKIHKKKGIYTNNLGLLFGFDIKQAEGDDGNRVIITLR